MNKIIRKLPLIYESLKYNPINNCVATITTLKLTKQELPKQPVPDLKKTADRYLRSLKPLIDEKEYCVTAGLVSEFITLGGIGTKLNCELLKRYECSENWLSDWWLDTAYLGFRAPVIVNSSPATVGPPVCFKCPDDVFIYAARLVRGVFDFDKFIKSGQLKQEMAGKAPLDMQPYGMILGTHRRPAKGSDKLIHTDDAKHIIIISNNHFFKLNILDNCDVLSEGKLISALKDIVERSCTKAKPVGILTGNDRDSWAEDHHVLSDLGKNKNVICDIESSSFILCLDKAISTTCSEKNEASLGAVQSLTGSGSNANAGNRWHDKTVQFIISPDGFVGMEYEHSPCEAIPIAVLFDHVLNYIGEAEKSKKGCDESKECVQAEHLCFETDKCIDDLIKKASHTVDKLCEDLDMECFTFNEFGTNEVKKMKMSPDSFIQTALQVTFYKLHTKPAVHYESAALRRFKSARTECVRCTSCESVTFAKAMACVDSKTSKKDLKKLMLTAVNRHKELVNEAVMGEGVDRHLYGLRMVAKCQGIELPKLYDDIGYKKSTHFTVTSSQVPYKTASFLCYGPAVPEGYGCCYNLRPADMLIACSSFRSCKDTNSKMFGKVLCKVLHDMKELGSVK